MTGSGGPHRFSIVPRPQYHPKYRPIEYKICNVTARVQNQKQADWDMGRLEVAIRAAAHHLGPFDSMFEHCCYQ